MSRPSVSEKSTSSCAPRPIPAPARTHQPWAPGACDALVAIGEQIPGTVVPDAGRTEVVVDHPAVVDGIRYYPPDVAAATEAGDGESTDGHSGVQARSFARGYSRSLRLKWSDRPTTSAAHGTSQFESTCDEERGGGAECPPR